MKVIESLWTLASKILSQGLDPCEGFRSISGLVPSPSTPDELGECYLFVSLPRATLKESEGSSPRAFLGLFCRPATAIRTLCWSTHPKLMYRAIYALKRTALAIPACRIPTLVRPCASDFLAVDVADPLLSKGRRRNYSCRDKHHQKTRLP